MVNRIFVAEPGEKDMAGKRWGYDGTVKRWVLWFGACAPTFVLSYSASLEDALEKSAELLAERGLVGLFAEEPETEADETDLLYTESGWLNGWEWGIVREDATVAELRAMVRR